jgi:hypothetical protein
MWEAADEEGVILRRGEQSGPGQGLNRLTPEERAAVLNLQARADKAFEEARPSAWSRATAWNPTCPAWWCR